MQCNRELTKAMPAAIFGGHPGPLLCDLSVIAAGSGTLLLK
jgi:hypothetical protein